MILVKYAAFHLSEAENAVLSPHSLRDMHRIHWLEPSWSEGYGLGSMQYKLGDWSISGHAGGYPGYLTGFTLCREQSTAVIVLTNALGSAPPEYINQGYQLVLPEIIRATEAAPPEAQADWQIYLGEYHHDWGMKKSSCAPDNCRLSRSTPWRIRPSRSNRLTRNMSSPSKSRADQTKRFASSWMNRALS